MHMAFLVARMFRCSVVFFIYIYNLCIKMLMAIKMPHLRMVEDGDTIFFCKCTIRLCDLLKFYVIFCKIFSFSNHSIL